MSLPKKYNAVVINVLLSAVLCLVINFSYLLTIREQERREGEALRRWERIENAPSVTGTLHVSNDGYGYIVTTPQTTPQAPTPATTPTPDTPADKTETTDTLTTAKTDSIYVPSREIERLSLTHGSNLRVVARDAHSPGGNRVMLRALEIDGRPYDYGEMYDHPSDRAMMVLQLTFYFLFAFILLTVMTAGATGNTSVKFYLTRSAYAIAIAVLLWFLLPVTRPRSDEITVMAAVLGRRSFFMFDIMIVKCSFVLAFALLYGRTYQLIHQREVIMLENEQLKSENLRARYNTLVGQLNPHFLFNSLNSLSALVREGKIDDAVRYIDRLSDTFRYTIRNEPDAMTTLGEELEFVNAYKYLLEVRYDEKLFIDIDIAADRLRWTLPAFSIQPLVENAVKHNSITRARPLRISIHMSGDRLVVSNPIQPKLEPERGTGIGLANLANRWKLLTTRDIEISNDTTTFAVSMPLLKP
ncbi:MAG: histidine kinase [Alistipes sp.]|jgi:hypothetical protein|nr:histidine kinase [Alistipes sp.]